jgi:ubiquinone/menaquinone biosynthesis C-methylase UbiE
VHRRRFVLLLLLLLVTLAAPAVAPAQHGDHDRDGWQRPDEVMNALGLGPGSRVADVGCGDGWFVVRLAERVGPEGRVYAVDIDEDLLARLRRTVERRELAQVEIIRGETDDPLLPAGELDAALIVNAYHEMDAYDAMLSGIFRALRPGGRLALIDAAGPDDADRRQLMRRHTMSVPLATADAERNGFRLIERRDDFDRGGRRNIWFFLLFEKPGDDEL